MSSSYRSNILCLLYWDPYAVCRGGCLVLYYCNMVEWFWWDSSMILTTNWFPSVLWHCWFGHLACKNRPRNDLLCIEWDVKPYTLTHSMRQFWCGMYGLGAISARKQQILAIGARPYFTVQRHSPGVSTVSWSLYCSASRDTLQPI